MKILAFFSNRRGIGTTTLVHHLAWMLQELGVNTIAADLDPQASLTEVFLDREDLQDLWLRGDSTETILGALQPLLEDRRDVAPIGLRQIGQRLCLLPGHPSLSLHEEYFEDAWRCPESPDTLRLTTAVYRATKRAAEERGAEVVLLDLGPTLGALNRAALVTSDFVITILGMDFCFLQGLHIVVPALARWRKEWEKRLEDRKPQDPLPSGSMVPAGYVILRPSAKAGNMKLVHPEDSPPPEPDPHRLGILKHYPSLMLLAQDARKPMFLLKPADGAIGGHSEAVLDCYRDFKALATKIATACGVAIPAGPTQTR